MPPSCLAILAALQVALGAPPAVRVGPFEVSLPAALAWSSSTASTSSLSLGAWPYDPPAGRPDSDGPPPSSFAAAVASQRPGPAHAPRNRYAPPEPTVVAEVEGAVRGRRAVAFAQTYGRDTTWAVVVDAGDAWLRVRPGRPAEALGGLDALALVASALRFPGEAGFETGYGLGPAALAPGSRVRVSYAQFDGPLGRLRVGLGDGRPGGVDTEARVRLATTALTFGAPSEFGLVEVRDGGRRVAGLMGGELVTEEAGAPGRSFSWQTVGPGPEVDVSWSGSAAPLADDLAAWDAMLDGVRYPVVAPAFGVVGVGDVVAEVPEGFPALGARGQVGGVRVGVAARWAPGLDGRARAEALRAYAEAWARDGGASLDPARSGQGAWRVVGGGSGPALVVDAGGARVTLSSPDADLDALAAALRTPADDGFGRAGWLYLGPVAFDVPPSPGDFAVLEAGGALAQLWLGWWADGRPDALAPPPPPPTPPSDDPDLERAVSALREDRELGRSPRTVAGLEGTETVSEFVVVDVPHVRSAQWATGPAASTAVEAALATPGGAPSPVWEAVLGSLRRLTR